MSYEIDDRYEATLIMIVIVLNYKTYTYIMILREVSRMKQTLLFKETGFVWFWVSLRGRTLLLPLTVDAVGRTWCFWRLLPFFCCKGVFDTCTSLVSKFGSSDVTAGCCWLDDSWSSTIPTNIFRFCWSVKVVDGCSVAACLNNWVQVKEFWQINKRIIIRNVSKYIIHCWLNSCWWIYHRLNHVSSI